MGVGICGWSSAPGWTASVGGADGGGYPTRKAAEEALARLRGLTGTAVTVGEWLDRWLRDHAGAASTVAGYANHVRLYLDPQLGGLLPGELTVEHVREMFAAIVHDHQAEGRRIRQETLNRLRSTLRSALNTALRDGLIVENPAALLVMPVARRPRAVVWTAAPCRGVGADRGASGGGGVDG
ncbi:hypothetical protein [Actinomadura madurae]|uniref:hypothetical protein n=1 Tax=Actinomadura madurae TaxID=1993 RepID=UPI000D87D8BD|nr:hypothetical protein [Actinomadura madurae]SPT51311.1 Site-specific recombinase XerD [Actinomadura madurae]